MGDGGENQVMKVYPLEAVSTFPLREPEAIIAEASKRAKALKDMVLKTKTSIMIGNQEHLNIEAWTTIADFYSCKVQAGDAQPLEVFGVKGFKAHANVVHIKSGTIVSSAEAFCLQDEEIWGEKPLFQLASMAQTRAASKACSLAFRWVVVLAGYVATPAEEMLSGPHPSPVFRFPAELRGKTPADLTVEQLCLEQARYQQLAEDPTNKWREENQKMVEAIQAELLGRNTTLESQPPMAPSDIDTLHTDLKTAPTVAALTTLFNGILDSDLNKEEKAGLQITFYECLAKLKKKK